jgi:hypothetical protein
MSETSTLMDRPKRGDRIVLERAWELFMPKIKRYLGEDWREEGVDDLKQQLMRSLRSGKDGYGMARELERDGWGEDRELCDVMDEAEDTLISAEREMVLQWITVYSIQASRSVGDTVSTTHWRRRGELGVITKIDASTAEYRVRFADMPYTSAQILKFEEVIDVPKDSSNAKF